MSERPSEVSELHTRLLKCALEVEESRAYWQRVAEPGLVVDARQPFEEYWFGSRSQDRVKVLLANLRARFDAYPEALVVLHGWPDMRPETRVLVCHWHLQLSDPLYRAFAGEYLVRRIEQGRGDVSRDPVVVWVGEQGPGRWTMKTRVQFASKLLSAAYSAGLVTSVKDPRPLRYPRVSDEALSYLLYLLRGVVIEGSLLDNPYLRSVGLWGVDLSERIRRLPDIGMSALGGLSELHWSHADLGAWHRALHGAALGALEEARP